jgi:hypothetical protein
VAQRFLTDQNFGIKGSTITINVGGYVLVYFRQQNTQGCNQFDPTWNKLLKMDTSPVQLLVADVTQCRKLISESTSTKIPITATPKLVFFAHNVAKSYHQGLKTEDNVLRFINECIERVSQPQQQQRNPQSFSGQMNVANAFGNTGLKTNSGAISTDQEYGGNAKLEMPPELIPKNTPWIADEKTFQRR